MTPTLMDEAVRRINCIAVGAWLEAWLAALGLPLPTAFGPTGEAVTPRASGLVLRIGALARAQGLPDPRDRLHLIAIEADASAPMPLGLDPDGETLATATARLSSSIVGGSPGELAAGDRRVSFFMEGGRVIELRFLDGLVGFDRLLVARLGEPGDWRNPADR
ncbi:hypothetical protein [Methylobacterium terrae]|uniref:hypothetical protein n=1 Tax=Methylobacterium terrae TaxID=2202827 RepID=UPI0013A5799F|nr:hypothetical protein [Methylobacterium terrae]